MLPKSTGRISDRPLRALSAFSMAASRRATVVLARKGSPLKFTIAAAGLLYLVSMKKHPKMGQNAMMVRAAGERTLVVFGVLTEGDLGEEPVKKP